MHKDCGLCCQNRDERLALMYTAAVREADLESADHENDITNKIRIRCNGLHKNRIGRDRYGSGLCEMRERDL